MGLHEPAERPRGIACHSRRPTSAETTLITHARNEYWNPSAKMGECPHHGVSSLSRNGNQLTRCLIDNTPSNELDTA